MRLLYIVAGFSALALLIYLSRSVPQPQFDSPATIARPGSERMPAGPRVSLPRRSTIARPDADPDLLSRLQANSARPWLMSWSNGALIRLSGARLTLAESSVPAAAASFLHSYAGLLGVSRGDLKPQSQRQMEGNVQVIYRQELGGNPVFNSRINMIFDGGNNLIYLSSNVYSGSSPPVRAEVSLDQASSSAEKGLSLFRISKRDQGELVSAASLRAGAQLGFRLLEGTIALVYKFTFTISDSPLGDIEIFVDAGTGHVMTIKSLSRN